MTSSMIFALIFVISLVLTRGESSSNASRKMLQDDDDQVAAVRLNARSVEQAAALARAGIAVQPTQGYLGASAPSQAPMPGPAPSAAETALIVGIPRTAPAPVDAIAEVPQRDFDDLGTRVASLPLYPEDGYGL